MYRSIPISKPKTPKQEETLRCTSDYYFIKCFFVTSVSSSNGSHNDSHYSLSGSLGRCARIAWCGPVTSAGGSWPEQTFCAA